MKIIMISTLILCCCIGCGEKMGLSGKYFLIDPVHQDVGAGLELVLNRDNTYVLTRITPIVETVENIETGERHQERGAFTEDCNGTYIIENQSLKLNDNKFPKANNIVIKGKKLYLGKRCFILRK